MSFETSAFIVALFVIVVAVVLMPYLEYRRICRDYPEHGPFWRRGG